jgi:hypothetical protein
LQGYLKILDADDDEEEDVRSRRKHTIRTTHPINQNLMRRLDRL